MYDGDIAASDFGRYPACSRNSALFTDPIQVNLSPDPVCTATAAESSHPEAAEH